MRVVLTVFILAAMATSCTEEPGTIPLDLPNGVLSRLEVTTDGKLYSFGPFVGYYFKPAEMGKFDRLSFWCYNERGFYTSDLPENALLYTGEARLGTLKKLEDKLPGGGDRIRPVFFDQAPQEWVENRPEPKDEYLHFHSMHDRAGPVLIGYWLRHVAEETFTYDMGGRVSEGSPLYHLVTTGVDLDFARIIEFDRGP